MKPLIIAGSCMLESEAQGLETAAFVKAQGADIFRAKIWGGGTHKPKDVKLWGKGRIGLKYMATIQRRIEILVATEIRQPFQLELWLSKIDFCIEQGFTVFWIAARSMQDYYLLNYINENLAFRNIKVILKRGAGNTINEVMGALSYLNDIKDLWVCERGIVSFDRQTETRWRPDILGIVQLKEKGCRVLFDPSHACGRAEYVIPMSLAALTAGADGLMVEVHKTPEESWSDQKQALDFEGFKKLMEVIENGKKIKSWGSVG